MHRLMVWMDLSRILIRLALHVLLDSGFVHLALFTSSGPYMSSLFWATAVCAGHLDVLP